jgi:hypothetical protein
MDLAQMLSAMAQKGFVKLNVELEVNRPNT